MFTHAAGKFAAMLLDDREAFSLNNAKLPLAEVRHG
jgi:hypothetical protein